MTSPRHRNFPHLCWIQRDKALAKFWLKPVMLATSTRFSAKEIRELHKYVENNRDRLQEAWNEYFKG
ncbi:DUF4160 domain-containing protein [Sansalvadorimonas verongulae]|uniref:DUF4160 domain-containing protein n=1 Tax=Sansalvadorimonas verongulae TaxID=2172824 RepID=UPI0038B5A16D